MSHFRWLLTLLVFFTPSGVPLSLTSYTFPIILPTLELAMELMDNEYTSGSNSVVEFLPSKQVVAGSSPVSRSTIICEFIQ